MELVTAPARPFPLGVPLIAHVTGLRQFRQQHVGRGGCIRRGPLPLQARGWDGAADGTLLGAAAGPGRSRWGHVRWLRYPLARGDGGAVAADMPDDLVRHVVADQVGMELI